MSTVKHQIWRFLNFGNTGGKVKERLNISPSIFVLLIHLVWPRKLVHSTVFSSLVSSLLPFIEHFMYEQLNRDLDKQEYHISI